jgi:DNA-directed RNA polymerase specialized sigma24 family protein
MASLDAEIRRYRESIHGGGLWDFDEDVHAQQQEQRKIVERYDATPALAYLESSAHQMPTRELEVALLYWRDGIGIARIASRLGIAAGSVQSCIARTRQRIRAAGTKAAA